MESISDEEKFEIDRIVAERKRKGVLEYLVSWKGAAETTWEPAKTIAVDCAHVVQNFVKQQKLEKTKSKSRSKSRSRSRSRSRKSSTIKTRKSSRSRSEGRREKQKSTTQSVDQEETAVRRSARQQKAATLSETKEEKVVESMSKIMTITASSNSDEKSTDAPRRSLRITSQEEREKLEVQRVHNDQRPVREDDSKPRSPFWRVADYIVIVLFIISVIAAVFLFLEKFFDLSDFKRQAFPNLGVLKNRLVNARQGVVDLFQAIGGYASDAWLYLMENIKLPKTSGQEQQQSVPK